MDDVLAWECHDGQRGVARRASLTKRTAASPRKHRTTTRQLLRPSTPCCQPQQCGAVSCPDHGNMAQTPVANSLATTVYIGSVATAEAGVHPGQLQGGGLNVDVVMVRSGILARGHRSDCDALIAAAPAQSLREQRA